MSTTNQNSGNSTLKWTFMGVAIIILIITVSSKIEFHKKEKLEKQKTEMQHNRKIEPSSPKYDYTYDTVYFSGEYDKIVYLPGGNKFVFLNASEPFCVMNSDGLEVCGERGEDPDIGKSSANKKLRFKSQNGKDGTIVIKSWTK